MDKTYDEAIGQLTNQTNKKLMRFLNSNLENYGITLEQWNVLLRLSYEDKINQKNLAHSVDKDQPTLARILDILERKELVVRQNSIKDKREFIVQITEKGLQLKNKVAPLLENWFEIMLDGISENELEIYKAVLMKIMRNIVGNEESR